MYWVLYAMFMFHPENNVAWRITETVQFSNQVECKSFYFENQKKLVNGLKDHMVGNFGPTDNGLYTLMEVGCVIHNGKDPIVTKRIPLSTVNILEDFIAEKIDV